MLTMGDPMLTRRSISTLLALIFVLGLSQVFPRHANAYEVSATISVGNDPGLANGVGVNPLTNRIYVSNNFDNTVSVIDGVANAMIATIPVGTQPGGVGVNPATNRIYVANFGNNTVSAIDTATNAVIATIPVDQGPFA